MANDPRIYDIYTSARDLFILKGYNQTQIADIARRALISTGAVYNLFVGKKAIFEFVLRCIADDSILKGDVILPVGEMNMLDLKRLIEDVFDKIEKLFDFSDGKKMWTFEEMISHSYDIISKYGKGFLIFEKNTVEWPELSALYYEKRKQFIDIVEKYLNIYIQNGEIRKVQHAEYYTRLIIEVMSWWGMHRKYDLTQNKLVDDEIAKSIVLDTILHAYAK